MNITHYILSNIHYKSIKIINQKHGLANRKRGFLNENIWPYLNYM